MVNLTAGSNAGGKASLTLDKREYLESKFPRASSEIISSLQETVSSLNQSIREENLKLRF